ncbi:hypothetical protein [Burkholderia ubonensis]|uniref:hypothetical protein n=1 Tax=Burkholderia ubonensis TaxID=101571 RepID=UPI0012F78071|nr:hypothetical protein [Burkholderia ubonensis]
MLFHSMNYLACLSDSCADLAMRPGKNGDPVERYTQREGSALESLARVLDEARLKPAVFRDGVTVLLGFPHLQLVVVPWQDGVSRPSEFDGLAREMFIEQFGPDSEHWTIMVEQAGYGQARVAVSVEPDWLDDIRAVLKSARLRMAACRPLILEASQRFRQRLADNCLFMLVEPTAVSCLNHADGGWREAITLSRPEGMPLGKTLHAVQFMLGDIHKPIMVVSNDGLDDDVRPDEAVTWLGSAHPWLDRSSP